MGRVVVMGSLIVDLVARAAHLPGPGETLLGTDFGEFLGGKGCNQAVAAARQRAQVAMIGRVGADAHGDSYVQALAHEGIDGSGVRHDPEVGTGLALIYVGEDTGQNMIIVAPQANMRLSKERRRGRAGRSSPRMAMQMTDGFFSHSVRFRWRRHALDLRAPEEMAP